MSESDLAGREEARDRRFLDGLADCYPYRVEGPGSIRGMEGDEFGDCISRPIPEGRRTWAFETKEARDAFAAARGIVTEGQDAEGRLGERSE